VKALVKTLATPGALEWREWPEPVNRPDEAIVSIRRAAICSTDLALYEWNHPGRRAPRVPFVLGHEGVGVVTAVGDSVRDLREGDRVALQVIWGRPYSRESMLGREDLDPDWYQLGASDLGGAFAERIALPATKLVRLPSSTQWDDAVLLEPLACACHTMERVALAPGESFVLVGPGPFGLLMCQIARSSGARHIVVVGRVPEDNRRLEMARACGADTIVEFEGDLDATRSAILEATDGLGGDAVVDAGGTTESTQLALDSPANGGRIALFGYSRHGVLDPLRQIIRKGVSVFGISVAQRRHYGIALRMIESGAARPSKIITAHFPFTEAVAAIEQLLDRREPKAVLIA
jgi:threonine dehydrogenase-like Zn-dependent dehydrogenase